MSYIASERPRIRRLRREMRGSIDDNIIWLYVHIRIMVLCIALWHSMCDASFLFEQLTEMNVYGMCNGLCSKCWAEGSRMRL